MGHPGLDQGLGCVFEGLHRALGAPIEFHLVEIQMDDGIAEYEPCDSGEVPGGPLVTGSNEVGLHHAASSDMMSSTALSRVGR